MRTKHARRMAGLLFAGLLAVGTAFAGVPFEDWKTLGGPGRMGVKMMVSDATNPLHLVAIVDGEYPTSSSFAYRVFETTDGGRTWMHKSDYGQYGSVTSIAAFDCKRMYIGVGGMVLRTSDGGTTWTESLYSTNWSTTAKAMCAHPTDSNTVYMVGPGFFGKSSDAGETWTYNNQSALTQIAVNNGNVPCLVISPSNPDYMLVSYTKYSSGQWYAFAALSTNGGLAWLDISSRIDTTVDSQLYAAAFDPNDHRRMYLSGHYFYASADGGATWQKNTAPASVWNSLGSYTRGMSVLAVDPVNSSNIYGAYSLSLDTHFGRVETGLLVSRDYGTNWTRIADPNMRGVTLGGGYTPTHIEVMKASPSNILVSSYLGFFRSYDAGQTLAGADTHFNSDGVYGMAVSARRLVAATSTGLFRSDNGGDDWTSIAAGGYQSCVISPTDPNTMLAIQAGG